jgi:hypothetical protein
MPLWRLRLAREYPKYLLVAVATFGLLASARFAIAPPRPPAPAPVAVPAPADLAAQAYAALFARRYLTWDAREPLRDAVALEQFAGSRLAPAAGFVPPQQGAQSVDWVEVVQAREPVPGEHVYVVAAQTRPAGLLYLAVSVRRAGDGVLSIVGYPSFVGAPASAPASPLADLPPVEDRGVQTVVRRALTNYLAGQTSDLSADLAPAAPVAVPSLTLNLVSVERDQWAPGGGAVLATVQASDTRGAHYVLAYELDVARTQGRWEISAIETDPDE